MNIKKVILKCVIFLVILLVVFIAIFKLDLLNSKEFAKLENYINSYGHIGGLVYIAIFTLRSLVLVLPYSVMVVIGGHIFGPFKGFIYSMISVILSASLAFFAARTFGKGLVQRLVGDYERQMKIYTDKYGFRVLFLMRLSTLFPFDAVNFAAGLTEISYTKFILANFFGMILETFVLSYIGDNLKYPLSWRFIAAVLFAAAFVVMFLIIKKHREEKIGNK